MMTFWGGMSLAAHDKTYGAKIKNMKKASRFCMACI